MALTAGISLTAKYLGQAIPWAIRWRYPETRLAGLLDIATMGTGECVTLNNANHDAGCWLIVTNLSPFTVAVDRLEASLVTDGAHATVYELLPHALAPATKEKVFCRGAFVASPAGMEVARKAERFRVDIRAWVRCSVRDFSVSRSIDDVKNFRVMN